MDPFTAAIYSISKGDCILIRLFTPVIIPILGWLTWDVSKIHEEN